MKKIYIISERIKDKSKYSDGIILTENDFNPCKSFFAEHPDIKPESIDYIYTKGVLEDFEYLRCLVKNIDWMLRVGGILELDFLHLRLGGLGYAIRPEDEIAYEIASVFKERIHLEDMSKRHIGKPTHRIYKKVEQALQQEDTIDSWTFGIVSDGRKNERILQIIDKIQSFGIQHYEILICGPSPSRKLPINVKVLDDNGFYSDKRIPLCKKKNSIILHAQYGNLCIIHDRIMFSDQWYKQIKKEGNYFDAFTPAILDEETKSKHVIDFVSYPNYAFGKYQKVYNNKKWSPNLYMDGAIITIKSHVAKEILQKPYLHWGEKEDVDFARRIYQNGYIITVNHNIKVYTLTYSKKGANLNKNLYLRLKEKIFAKYFWWKMYNKEKNILTNYLYE